MQVYDKLRVFMRARIWTILTILLLVGACSNGARIGNYTLWGGYSNYTSGASKVAVRKGDTLYSIANRNNVPLRSLIETNNLYPPYTLKVGQTLRLPAAKYHIVAKGDTLYNISKRYNVDMPKLSAENNLSAPFTLKLGQKLTIPDSLYTKSSKKSIAAASAKKTTKSSTAPKSVTKYSYVQPSTNRKQKFDWPVKGQVVSGYGPIAKGRNNDGINIKAPAGTAVKAADSGTVAYAGNELKGFGNLVLIKHDDGWVTAYAHNQTLKVKKGQKVKRGEQIATVGSTGGVGTPQLHFETRAGKKALNPQNYLR
ncbi:MAG: M23 family metallopeptidase [Alphaproteobacteria bacterium]|nr:M23 family metallopeptidase [Alphaproteobacteria bacterium]